jgi:hypothetical protein
VLAALDLAHMRALDARLVRQFFLRDTHLEPGLTNRCSKSLRHHRVTGGHALGPSGLHGPLVHQNEGVVASLRKPRRPLQDAEPRGVVLAPFTDAQPVATVTVSFLARHSRIWITASGRKFHFAQCVHS